MNFGSQYLQWSSAPLPLNPYDQQAQNYSSPFTSWEQLSGTQNYNSTNVNCPPQCQQLASPSSDFVSTKTPSASPQTLIQVFNSDEQAKSQNKEGSSGRATGTHSTPHSSQSSDGSSVLPPSNNKSSLPKKRKYRLPSCSNLQFEAGTVASTASDRAHIFYQNGPEVDGKYKCPFVNCRIQTHVKTTQKNIYWTYLDTHLKPYKSFCGISFATRRSRDSHDDDFHCESEPKYLCTHTGCRRGIKGEGYHLCTELRKHWDLEHHGKHEEGQVETLKEQTGSFHVEQEQQGQHFDGQRAADLKRIKVLERELDVERARTAELRKIIQGLGKGWAEDKQECTISLEKYMREVVDYSVRTQKESEAYAMKFQEQLSQAMAIK